MAKEQQFVSQIADIESDFPQWYSDVVLKTKLVDYGPVKGTMVIRPYGYAIWENIQKELDKRFKETGHENAYFPLLIPMSFMTKEAEHVEGFAPEVAVVTHAGGEKLAEPLCIRPTSETIIGTMYGKWIQSYRDLPVLMNQWANVMRWEKTTRPFLRTSEFLWQEGHTVHATEEEAMEETMKMLSVYEEFAKTCLSMPVLTGRKTEKEKFAGAVATFGMEAMMHDGKSLQAGTSHYFGDNFAKAFEIEFQNRENKPQNPHQTSWGVSTRLIGGIIMTHGDDNGLVLPPAISPIQVIVIPVAQHKEGVIEKAQEVKERLSKQFRTDIDISDNSPGWKFAQYEMKGVPLRLEIGPKDIEQNQCVLVRRDNREKTFVSLDELEVKVAELLQAVRDGMYQRALANRERRTFVARTLDEMVQVSNEHSGFIKAMWCGDAACEEKLKEVAGVSSRCMPFDQEQLSDTCVCCGKPAKSMVIWGKAY